jgi:hypothetical protein
MPPRARAPPPNHGKARSPCGTDPTWIATDTARHALMMTDAAPHKTNRLDDSHDAVRDDRRPGVVELRSGTVEPDHRALTGRPRSRGFLPDGEFRWSTVEVRPTATT